ncbi:hypothetical protein WJX75_009081 [Coccomyxa subellipsoidea]|uniref:Fungal lipase-type domain-containing protein n=1 Tax=Coccomyxa subellipsoidea TaxID=248742 RepID=A0ABR2YLJ9_9CHLO
MGSPERAELGTPEQRTPARPQQSSPQEPALPTRPKRPGAAEVPLGDAAGRVSSKGRDVRTPVASVAVPLRPSGGNAPGRMLAEQPGAMSAQALSSALKAPAPSMPQRPSQRGDTAGEPAAAVATVQPQQGLIKDAGLKAEEVEKTLRQNYGKGDEEKGIPSAPSLASSSGSSSGHFDPTGSVVMRIEYLRELDLKWTIAFIHCAEVVGLAVLVLVLLAKLCKPDNYFIADNTLVLVNACTAIILWLVLLEFFLIYLHHVHRANRLRRAWSRRRFKGTVVLFVEAISQLLNLSFFVIPNVYVLVRPCGWRDDIVLWSAFASWTCWNTLFLMSVVRVHNLNLWLDREGNPKGDRADATLLDAPWSVHAPKLILWAGAEALKATSVHLVLNRKHITPPYMPPGTEEGDCRQWTYDCRHDTVTVVLISLESAVFLAYFALFFFYLGRAFRQLRARNYRDFRMANLSVRLIVRTRVAGMVFFVACVVIYYYVKLGSCLSYVSSALGLLPMQFVMTALIIVMLYMFMPKDPDAQDQVLQVWLQEFAWTEAEKLRRLKDRSSNLRLTSIVREEVDREPMFCFETAIKLYYFSHIIYFYDKLEGVQSASAGKPHDEVTHIGVMRRKLTASLSKLRHGNSGSGRPRVVKPTANNLAAAAAAARADGGSGDGLGEESVHAGEEQADSSSHGGDGSHQFARGSTGPNSTSGSSEGASRGRRARAASVTAEDFSLDAAMGLYGLEHMEVMWERRHDTMALLGWGPGRIVIVFRGTNSLKNVAADLQAWQVPHPPPRGNHFCGGRPAVHQGFLKSWTANGLGQRIVERVLDIVTSHEWACTKVYLTGHSLGGALANLAAYDIARALERLNGRVTRVICYTFGSPRTGNHAFAHDYQRVVPDTWSIINDQDAVARNAKFWVLYKRPGQRVLINVRGDMLVRPSFAELSIQQTPVGSSVFHHYLLAYRDALAAICRAQMNRKKRLQGGLAGVMALLEGDEFVRGILEPAGLTLSDVQESQTASLRRLSVQPAASAVPEVAAEQTADDMARASVLTPMTSAFERSMAARAGSLQLGHLSPSARDEADAMEAGEAGRAALPRSNSLRSLSSAESWKTALSTARPSADLDASLASLPPSMLGPRRDCNGLQTSTPDGASPPDGSRHGPSDTGTANDDAAQKGAASKAAAAFEKENAQPNGLASAAAFLRTAPVPGEAWPVRGDWDEPPAGEKQGSFPGFWRLGDPGTPPLDGVPAAPPLSDSGYPGEKQPSRFADGAAAGPGGATGASSELTAAAAAAAGRGHHGTDSQQPGEAATAAGLQSKAAGQEASERLVDGVAANRDEGGLSAGDGLGGVAGVEVPGSEHDLGVATGFTGAPGLLQRPQNQSPTEAISSFLAAQRGGGSISPQVRIAAAYALANGAVNQKQKLKDRAAARLAREQAEQNGAAEGLSGTQGKALADSSRAAASAAAVSAVLTSTTEPQPYRVNLEFYRSPDATSFSDGGAPTVGGPGSASMPGAVSGAPGNAQATSGAGNAPGAPQAGTAPEMAAAGAAAGAAAALGTGRGGTAPAAGTGPGTAAQPEASSGVAAPEIEQQPAEQGRADGQAAPHAEAAVGAFVKGKSEGGSGSAGSSPKRMETPRPVVSPGVGTDMPLTPDQEPGKRRMAASSTTTGSSRRNSESAEATSEGGWPSSSSGGWPSSSSSVDVQAYRAALRERVLGSSPVREGQGAVPWDMAGINGGPTVMQPILEGTPHSTSAAPGISATDSTAAVAAAGAAIGSAVAAGRDLQPLAAPVTSIGGRSGTRRSGKRKAAAAPGVAVPTPAKPDATAIVPSDANMAHAATGEDVSTSEEDTSPRSRAMSAFLARRKAAAGESAAVAAAAAVRAVRAPLRRPSLPATQATPPETGLLMPRAATDDGMPERSPPRVRRKASPRELAEAFKGHGLRQATWAPVPIFWARSVEELPMSRGQLPALPAAAAEQEASGQIIAQPPAQFAPPTEQPAREPEVHASPRQEAAVPIVEAAAKEPSPVKGPETP